MIRWTTAVDLVTHPYDSVGTSPTELITPMTTAITITTDLHFEAALERFFVVVRQAPLQTATGKILQLHAAPAGTVPESV